MTRGILIAGNESTLFSAAAAEAARRVESFATAVIPNRFTLPGDAQTKTEGAEKSIPLSWNPASPISGRSLVFAAENRLGKISNAILICSPPAVFKSAGDLAPEEIEILLNDHIKGWFFLVRELILYSRRVGDFSLSFVAPELSGGKNSQTDILGPSVTASFKSFANGILATAASDALLAMGFSGSKAGAETEFASWLFKIIDSGAKKNSGRWHKYSKYNLFK